MSEHYSKAWRSSNCRAFCDCANRADHFEKSIANHANPFSKISAGNRCQSIAGGTCSVKHAIPSLWSQWSPGPALVQRCKSETRMSRDSEVNDGHWSTLGNGPYNDRVHSWCQVRNLGTQEVDGSMIRLTKIWINHKLRYPAIEPPRAVGLYSCLATSAFSEFRTSFLQKVRTAWDLRYGHLLNSQASPARLQKCPSHASCIRIGHRCCRHTDLVKQNHPFSDHGEFIYNHPCIFRVRVCF